jgi:hypothetical protein
MEGKNMKLRKLSLLMGSAFLAIPSAQADRNNDTYACPTSDTITIEPQTNTTEWKVIGEGKEIPVDSDVEEVVLFKGTYKPETGDKPVFADPRALKPVPSKEGLSEDLWNLSCESHLKDSPDKKLTLKIAVTATSCKKHSKAPDTFKCIPG